MANDKLLCIGQKAFIVKGSEVLVLFDPKSGLDFPGGKIQEGEEKDLLGALKREVKEETQLEIKVENPFAVWYYKFLPGERNYGKEVYLVGFRCQYVSGEVKISYEHSSYRWVNKKTYKELDDGSDYFGALEKFFDAL